MLIACALLLATPLLAAQEAPLEEKASLGELLRVLEREPASDRTALAHFALGDLFLDRGDWESAARHLQLAREGALRGSQDDVAERALERMAVIGRLILRPLAGKSRWRESRPYLPEHVGIDKPRGIAAGPGGELVVTQANRAALLDASGAPTVARDLRGIVRAAHAANGAGAVIGADGVSAIDAQSVIRFERPGGGDLDRILAAYQGPSGNWEVISRRAAEISRHAADGRVLETFRTTMLNEPIDLAVSRDGSIHVLDAGSRQAPPSVLRFDADGNFREAFRADWRRPVALDIDFLGNHYVLDAGNLQVLVYDPVGNPLATIGPVLPGGQELRAPEDVAVDRAVRIFIADSRLGTVLVLE